MTQETINGEWEPCANCDGTGRANPDPARYGGARVQGATSDQKIQCTVCRGTGRVSVKKPEADSE